MLPFFFSGCYIETNPMQISRLARARLSLFEHTLVWLDRNAPGSRTAAHLETGARGEDAAYFHLRRMGYIIVARRWRSAKLRGDVDLIGWDGDWLCFIEVKTRSTRAFEPAEAAVDVEKRKMLRRMAREYMRHMDASDGGEQIPARFDIVSIYPGTEQAPEEFEIFQGAFDWQEREWRSR